jgi:hypothetical protein
VIYWLFDCLPKDKKTMQPNNNLVFYLAGDENEIGVPGENKPIAAPLKKATICYQRRVSSRMWQVLLSEHAPQIVVKAADLDEVDWIATFGKHTPSAPQRCDDVP